MKSALGNTTQKSCFFRRFLQYGFTTLRAPSVLCEHLRPVDYNPQVPAGRRCPQVSSSPQGGRARLLAKVYEIHPFVYPKCSSDMEIIAIIMNPGEVRKILQSKIPVRGYLDKIERPPPGINTTSLN